MRITGFSGAAIGEIHETAIAMQGGARLPSVPERNESECERRRLGRICREAFGMRQSVCRRTSPASVLQSQMRGTTQLMRTLSATLAAAIAAASPVAAGLVKQLTIEPGKGVSFFIGSQRGTAIFSQEAGACGLSLALV